MNTPERTIVIGDIHGCLQKLEALMQRIDPRPGRDQLVFLGDYIDRGEDSYGVLDYLVEVKKKYPQTIFLMGNHEKMFLDFLAGEEQALFLHNGGVSTLKNYLDKLDNFNAATGEDWAAHVLEHLLPEAHKEFLEDLLPYYETEDFIMVHAGLREGVPLEKQSLEDLVWIREEFLYSEKDFGKRVIFGHTPFARPLVLFNKIGIDTGAVYGNTLTCVLLPELKFVSV
ncbi:MAG: serine/threonine protein phosphatase [Deltaproteobacteria bacterium]|nr:serine/threonine protein phosphatase [Deltaproteobacteria bacterium]MBW2071195.1 serine/threonine protein phosphatase [Deltaproteobacteria bacterium]